MTRTAAQDEAQVGSVTAAPDRPRGFARWIAANIGSAIPVAMAPIAFGLAALGQGDARGGALMMTAMTGAQLLGAVPIAAAGRRLSLTAWARVLIGFRTAAFAGLVLAVANQAALPVLVVTAGLAGLVNGAIFGVLRAVLNDMVASSKLPRALGLAATANELVFVGGPILAATVGGVSVVAAIAVMAVASALPLLLLPRLQRAQPDPTRTRHGLIRLELVVWLLAATSAAGCVASVEVGAVALALRHDLAPTAAFFFTVPLCVASVLGGVWTSVRNRRPRRRTVVVMLGLTAIGALAVDWDAWIGSTIAGVVVIGLFLAPLGTSFSLFLDEVLPPARRAEGFALLRTAKSVGLIITSAVIAFGSLSASLIVSAALACGSAITVVGVHVGRGLQSRRASKIRTKLPP